MHAPHTIFIDKVCNTLPKLHEKFQSDPLKIFKQRRKSAKKV